ncbi:MAG: hypothetical protein ACQEV0_16360, partial [Bacillota bacterium]
SPKGDHRKSRSRAKALVTSFVDVLLFSFQGSCLLSFLTTLTILKHSLWKVNAFGKINYI